MSSCIVIDSLLLALFRRALLSDDARLVRQVIIPALYSTNLPNISLFYCRQNRQGSRRNLLSASLNAEDAVLKPNQSFSIIFRGARTLDLMMKRGDRDMVLDALDNVLDAYQEAKVRVAKDVLLLRYIWLDVDKVRKIQACT